MPDAAARGCNHLRVAHASRVLVSASRRNSLRLWFFHRHTRTKLRKSPRSRDALASGTRAHTLSMVAACAMKPAMPKTKAKTPSANVHAVVGSDEGEVKRVAAELAGKLTPPGAGEFGLDVIDGAADNAEQATTRIRSTIEALQTLPFFGSTKVVWLKNANFLGDDQKARSSAVQAALEEFSKMLDRGIGSEVTFLISATEVDKRRSFYKTLLKRADVQVFDRLDSGRVGWEEEAGEIVRRHAKKRKLQLDDDALAI